MLTSTALILICKYRRMTGKTYQTFCCEHIVNCFFFSFFLSFGLWRFKFKYERRTENTAQKPIYAHNIHTDHLTGRKATRNRSLGSFYWDHWIRIEWKFYCYSTGIRTQSMDVQAGRNAMNGKIYKAPVHGNSDHLSFQLAIFPTVGFLSIWRPRKCTPRNIYRSE